MTYATVDIAFAKTHKYAMRESGDTVELVERLGGGFTLVMIDGQGSGKAAKTLSLLLSAKAVGLVKDGVRDGAVARATHDHLFAFRHGQVSATLDMLSVDMKTREIVISRNSDSPMLLRRAGENQVVPVTSGPIGRYQFTKPHITQFPAEPGTMIVMFTDGIPHSGLRAQLPAIDFQEMADRLLSSDVPAQDIADAVLAHAVERDSGKPGDDMAVIVLSIHGCDTDMPVRRLQASFPVTPASR